MSKKTRLMTELGSYRVLQTQIKMNELALDRVRNEYIGISSGGDGLSSGAVSKTVENEVIRKDKQEQALINEINELKLSVMRIDMMLDVLDEVKKRIIVERYFNNMNLYDVADIIGYCYKTTLKYHNQALDILLKFH